MIDNVTHLGGGNELRRMWFGKRFGRKIPALVKKEESFCLSSPQKCKGSCAICSIPAPTLQFCPRDCRRQKSQFVNQTHKMIESASFRGDHQPEFVLDFSNFVELLHLRGILLSLLCLRLTTCLSQKRTGSIYYAEA